jgi:replicative superfamily II helicase
MPSHRLTVTLVERHRLRWANGRLAQGMNLPAHLVVIMGTQRYSNGKYTEYDVSEVLQMVGRAGRAPFDTTGVAVIITKRGVKQRYEARCPSSPPFKSMFSSLEALKCSAKEAANATARSARHKA